MSELEYLRKRYAPYVQIFDRGLFIDFAGLEAHRIVIMVRNGPRAGQQVLLSHATISMPDRSVHADGLLIKADGTVGKQRVNHIFSVKWADLPRAYREKAVELYREWQNEIANIDVEVD